MKKSKKEKMKTEKKSEIFSIFYLIILLAIILIGFIGFIVTQITAQNESSSETANETNQTQIADYKPEIEITRFFPKESNLGNVQFNIQVQNNKNETLENVFAIVKGRGFSTYDVTPIEKLLPNERDYIFVNGNLAEGGEINLSITILKNVFYQKIIVFDVSKKINESEEEKKSERLKEISQELKRLKENYIQLELEISRKKEKNYDLSGVNLEDLKKFVRSIESSVIIKNLENAEANLQLAKEEYSYQKNKVDNAKVIPTLTRIKENALIISAILGAVFALIALSEILKKKTTSTVHLAKKVARKIKIRRNKGK